MSTKGRLVSLDAEGSEETLAFRAGRRSFSSEGVLYFLESITGGDFLFSSFFCGMTSISMKNF